MIVGHRVAMAEEEWMILGTILIGLGGVVAGMAGVVLPEGRRLGALFALVCGAGVGVVVLGIGALGSAHHEPSEATFFTASLLGFLSVCAVVWRLLASVRERRV
jgi:hypothetical protein